MKTETTKAESFGIFAPSFQLDKENNMAEIYEMYVSPNQMTDTVDGFHTKPSKSLGNLSNQTDLHLPEISVVIPCLNEADTLEICILKIRQSFEENDIDGEIIVADNGSTDDSVEIAERFDDVRIVHVLEKGYGSALMSGIQAARGKYVLMGDADDSYDFAEIPKYLAKLDEDYDLVMGCRLPKGGGRVMPKAMPFLHRWWGNPMFSYMARLWFKSPLNDVHCGMRAFRKDFYEEINQQCTGMEFATEMTIKASLNKYEIAEIPITLHKDGRKSHAPHLKTFRDGWRHLRLYVMYTPRWLFLLPGVFFVLLGLFGYAISLPQLKLNISNTIVTFDVHTLLFASLFIISGYQIIMFAFFTKIFAISEGLLPKDPKMNYLFSFINLERGLMLSLALLIAGFALLILAVNDWWLAGFGALNYSRTMRFVIPGAMLTAIGIQSVFSSFFASILGLKRK
jgi:glycosyltransferase involved in cell wall biosynthesis